jgi:hypothetical protein
MSMQKGIQRGALNPDKGLDTRNFLISISVALVAFILLIAGWLRYSASTGKPNVHPLGKAGNGNTAVRK